LAVTERTSRASGGAGRWKRRLRTGLLTLTGAATLFTAFGSAYAMKVLVSANEELQHDDSVEVDPEPEAEEQRPINVLILGSDTREGLTPEEQAQIGTEADVDGERSDTIIFAHFDPRRDHAVLVHFPRDLLVDIPGYGQDKINAAYTVGGPDLTLRTVRELTGLPIHHFVEVGFVGFRDIVEALGGVEVCVHHPLRDTLAGLNLPRAG
jgi:anionic cell wall polymer biosynthesis LytR-Cps2A-Psr (LCP) family protein